MCGLVQGRLTLQDVQVPRVLILRLCGDYLITHTKGCTPGASGAAAPTPSSVTGHLESIATSST